MRSPILTLTLLALLTALAACGAQTPEAVGPPPLPDPVLLMFLHAPATEGDSATDEQAAAVERLRRALYDRTSLSIDVRLVPRPADALAGLCASDADLPAVAWLDGLTYAAAEARLCGQPSLAVARQPENALPPLLAAVSAVAPLPTLDPALDADGDGVPDAPTEAAPDEAADPGDDAADADDESVEAEPTTEEAAADADAPTPEPTATPEPGAPLTGHAGLIIVNPRVGSRDLSAIVGRTFCRLGYDDLYSWLLPTLSFRARNIDLLRDATIRDLPDVPALVAAVAAGDCTMAGVPAGALEALGQADAVRLAAESAPLPYGVLVYGPEVQLGVRLALDEALLALGNSAADAALLRPLLAQDALVRATPDDFAALRDFLTAARLDLARLGE